MQEFLRCTACLQIQPNTDFYHCGKDHQWYAQPCKACKSRQERERRLQERALLIVSPRQPLSAKRCTGCKVIKPIEAFSFQRTLVDAHYRQSACKECIAQRRKQAKQRALARDATAYRRDINAKNALWRKANPAKVAQSIRQWAKNHPDKRSVGSAKRRALLAAAPLIEDVSLRVIYERDKHMCSLCHVKVKRKDASMDHIIPLSKGGEHSFRNIALAHKRCNAKKLNRKVLQQMRLF